MITNSVVSGLGTNHWKVSFPSRYSALSPLLEIAPPTRSRPSKAGSPAVSSLPARRTRWWDEAFTSFHDDGANDAVPLDYTNPPVVLCSRDARQRHTPTTRMTAAGHAPTRCAG